MYFCLIFLFVQAAPDIHSASLRSAWTLNTIILYFCCFLGLAGQADFLYNSLYTHSDHTQKHFYVQQILYLTFCQREMALLSTYCSVQHCLLSACLMGHITSIMRIALDKQWSNAASFVPCLMIHKSYPCPQRLLSYVIPTVLSSPLNNPYIYSTALN